MSISKEMQHEFEEWLELAPAHYTISEKIEYATEHFTRTLANDYEWSYFSRLADEPIVSDV